MASGIDNAQCVVVFITKRYVDKVGGTNPEDNCQLEFNYAARRKGANKMIGVVMESRMCDTSKWVGEVGLVLGGRLYADMTGDFQDAEYLDRCADDLYNRIMKVIGKPVPTYNIDIDPHVHHAKSSTGGEGVMNSTPPPNPPKKDTRPLNSLSVDDVSTLLHTLKLGKFVAQLKENEIDGAALAMCKSEDEIVEIGVSMQLKARVLYGKIQVYKVEGVPLSDLQGAKDESPKHEVASPKKEVKSSEPKQQSSSNATSLQVSCEAIGIYGVTGACSVINGIYEITKETYGGLPRFKKRNEDHWLEYNADQGKWHCKPGSKKGTVEAWAYCRCPSEKMLYESTETWHVYEGSSFHEQSQVVAYSASSFAVYGSNISVLDGIYDPTSEMYSGVCRYQKRDKSDYWFEFSSSLKHWHLTRHADKGTQQAFAFAPNCTKIPPWKQSLSWSTWNATTSSFVASANMIVIPEPRPLEVSGGSGSTAAYVAGIYDPTTEIYGGWVRYRKRTDPDSWIEYLASHKQWHIKPTSSKTQTNAWVMCSSDLKDPSEVSVTWTVYNGSQFTPDSGLKVKKL